VKILGISDSSVCGGAALYEDGRVTWAIDEERLNRQKLATGFPALSIAAVLEQAGVAPREIDAVLAADDWNYYQPTSERWRGWLQHSPTLAKSALYEISSLAAPLVGPLGGERLFYGVKKLATAGRRRQVRDRLRAEFGLTAPVNFVDHHHCHAMAAYMTGGRRRCTAITLDGGGDTLCSRVYRIRDDEIASLSRTNSFHSIGNFYAYVTHLCGFTAHKHEGKITGLAAHGEPVHLDLLRGMIAEEAGEFRNLCGGYYWSAVRKLERALPRGWRREDLAASIQKHLEAEVTRFVRHWVLRSGERDLVVAGGVFANVRLNQFVEELPEVDSLFVHPGMGDEGLAYGAACAGALRLDRERALELAGTPLAHVYLGNDVPRVDIEAALAAEGLLRAPIPEIELEVARKLAAGHVVARCAGRMEYGPRALGNRSILYRPDDPSVNDWLNKRLARTEFMPFAPMTPVELIDEMYERAQTVRHAAQFMTITRGCKAAGRAACPGVVHIDGTARPQYVAPAAAPEVHRILGEFRSLTGLSSVINTSFNIHDEPIVCSARDAVRAFLKGQLDYLALGDYLIEHPALAHRPSQDERVRAAVAEVVDA
jgi:carbamoyltransferase